MTSKFSYLLLGALSFLGILNAQTSDTTMAIDFQVTTSSPGGNFSPRNVGAIWIESSSGSFVKTLRVWGNNRRQYLYTWNLISGGNTVDGVTGATYSSHGTRTAQWDFTDVNGDTVPVGDYSLTLELTDQHSQGPLYSFMFPFMGSTETITPPEHSNFHSMQLSYDLTIIVGIDGEPILVPNQISLKQNFPNPFNPSTSIDFTLPNSTLAQLTIYDLTGRLIHTLVNDTFQAGQHQISWDGRNSRGESIQSGVYLCRLTSGGEFQTIKMVYLK